MKKKIAMFLTVSLFMFFAGTVWGATEGESNNFFGTNAGINTTGSNNSFFGAFTGYLNTTGHDNSFFGYSAGGYNTTGNHNNFFGSLAGEHNTTGNHNNFFGSQSGFSNTTAWYNNFIGGFAGFSNTTGYDNIFLGHIAGYNNTTGYENIYIGRAAGLINTDGSGNIFLGYNAGYNEIGSNKLYISNSDTDLPLIYGEFDNQYLEVNGSLNVQGTDAYNAFQLKVFGHTGGNSHAQMATDLADSRLSFMASEFNDFAPRLQLIGPQDVTPAFRGLVRLEYGSRIYNLPDARFIINHQQTNGAKTMMQIFGRNIVSFPTGNVGIGTTTPTHLIELAGGAYSNGATWVNASSRELKENIQEVSAEEAIQTVENLKPVTFNYKEGDQEQHIGFIAEDVPDLVATSDRKGLESMDIVAVLTKVVQELQKTVQEQQAMIGELQTALQFKQGKNANLAQVDVSQVTVK